MVRNDINVGNSLGSPRNLHGVSCAGVDHAAKPCFVFDFCVVSHRFCVKNFFTFSECLSASERFHRQRESGELFMARPGLAAYIAYHDAILKNTLQEQVKQPSPVHPKGLHEPTQPVVWIPEPQAPQRVETLLPTTSLSTRTSCNRSQR